MENIVTMKGFSQSSKSLAKAFFYSNLNLQLKLEAIQHKNLESQNLSVFKTFEPLPL
jgi:hypothetical protein